MPKVKTTVEANETDYPELRPFIDHGLDAKPKNGRKEAVCQCPFCGKPKLHVNSETSLWDCKTCGESGNAATFLRRLHEEGRNQLDDDDVVELMEHRGFIFNDTVTEWQVCKSLITGEWMVPGHRMDGQVHNLYRWTRQYDNSMRLYSTAGLSHELAGLHLWEPSKSTVVICEGVWDAMTLYEILARCKWFSEDGEGGEGSRLVQTGNLTASLLGDINVIAVPGANVWNDAWSSFLSGKRVVLAFDSDHPRPIKNTDRMAPPVGMDGMRRVAQSLMGCPTPPKSIEWIAWGKEGYDPDLADGYDVRDLLTESGDDLDVRIDAVHSLWRRIELIPKEWTENVPVTDKEGNTALAPLKCEKWSVLLNSCRKALKWLPGLEHGFACMLATLTSTDTVGDPIWMKLISVAGGGKTVLAEAMSINRKYVKAVSTFKGLFSGFQTDKDGNDDHSLMVQCKNKTLIIKEGDTLLKNSDRERVLSELRDAYDKSARPQYRNKMSKEYTNHNMTMILCGTLSLRSLDASDLGARFIDVVMMDKIDPETEIDILRRHLAKSILSTSMRTNGTPESHQHPDMIHMQRLTAGYINYLRENATDLSEAVREGLISDEKVSCKLMDLGRFVSFMRARMNKEYSETVQRELPTRISGQLARLGIFLAVVMNRKKVDRDVMARVRQVALDTSAGTTLLLSRHLYEAVKKGGDSRHGLTYKQLGSLMNIKDQEMFDYLQFLCRIEAVDRETVDIAGSKPTYYRLSKQLSGLYKNVVGK